MAEAARQTRERATYPTEKQVDRAVRAARAAIPELDIGAIEVSRQGAIRLVDARALHGPASDEFEKWDREGKLG